MALASLLSVYVLMYVIIDTFAKVYPNVNQFYMAGLMTAPMIAIEIALMGPMYPRSSNPQRFKTSASAAQRGCRGIGTSGAHAC